MKELEKREKEIYIPVWIDQKQSRIDEATKAEEDLHSSMDRLETF